MVTKDSQSQVFPLDVHIRMMLQWYGDRPIHQFPPGFWNTLSSSSGVIICSKSNGLIFERKSWKMITSCFNYSSSSLIKRINFFNRNPIIYDVFVLVDDEGWVCSMSNLSASRLCPKERPQISSSSFNNSLAYQCS